LCCDRLIILNTIWLKGEELTVFAVIGSSSIVLSNSEENPGVYCVRVVCLFLKIGNVERQFSTDKSHELQ